MRQLLTRRSRALTILLGVLFVLVGLLLNEWFLGWRFAEDGNIDRTTSRMVIWSFQIGCIAAGLWFVLKRPARIVFVSIIGVTTIGLVAGIFLGGYGLLTGSINRLEYEYTGDLAFLQLDAKALYSELFPQAYVPAGPSELPDYVSPDIPGHPSGSVGYSHYVFDRTRGGRVVLTLLEGPQGEQVRSALSYLQLKQVYELGGPPPEELQMSREELEQLVRQLDTVRYATEKYRDVKVALADGYTNFDRPVPNMGAHFVSPQRMSDGMFDPAQPEMLLYVPNASGGWELVGTAFMLPHVLQIGHDHPEGFAGPLDNWHIHYNECVGATPRIKNATQDVCQAMGGDWFPAVGWMIHAYVWVDNPFGVFHNWNPNIPPVIPASSIPETYPETTPDEGQVALTIKNFDFDLREAQLKMGETVVWTNVDRVPHTVTLGFWGKAEKGFDSSLISPGQSFVLKFDQPGEYSYTCTLHANMNGTISVNQ